MNRTKLAGALITLAALSGCAGGGGGGWGDVKITRSGNPVVPEPVDHGCGTVPGYDIPCIPLRPKFPGDPGYEDPYPPTLPFSVPDPVFRTWSELPSNAQVVLDGISGAVSYHTSSGRIVFTDATAEYNRSILAPTYDANGQLFSLGNIFSWPDAFVSKDMPQSRFATLAAVDQPGIDAAWNSSSPATAAPFSSRADNIALAANPHSLGWDYQSFGVWNDHFQGTITYRTYGAVTPASAMPSAGSATFSGKLAGLYVAPDGSGSVATANVAVDVNFGNRTLGFASSGTAATRDLSSKSAASNLNLNGTLSYAPGTNSFSGTLTNAGGSMRGSSKGQFYGPAAQELGGVFALKSATTVETFSGAYGAKR